MNICLVIISDGWGGGETVVYELAKRLRDRGENITIILNQEIFEYYDELDGVGIFNIGSAYNLHNLIKQIINPNIKINKQINLSFFPWSLINEVLRPIYFKRLEKQIMSFLLKHKIEVIHSHLDNSHLLISYLKTLDIAWIGTIHGGKTAFSIGDKNIITEFTLNKIKAKKIKQTFYKMNMITFVSNWLLELYQSVIKLEIDTEVIYNGIDLEYFQKISKNSSTLKHNFDLMFPGVARTIKNQEVMIEALSKIVKKNSKIHLYIAGNVPQNHNIRQMARDLKIDKKIIFTGHLMPQKYHRLLNSVDILLLPSKNEGLPISLLEAMAMGKSIIASNRGGIPEIIIDKRNGILVEPISDEVTDAILYIYKNNDFKKKIEYNNLQDIKKFDWDCIIDKYMIIYYKVVSNN